MSKRPALFTEADVKRAVRAVQAVGLAIGGVEITREGTIRVVLPDGQQVNTKQTLQDWLAENAR